MALSTLSCAVCASAMRAVCGFPESGRTVFRCLECGHRTLAPFPASEELERFYGRERYFSDDLAPLHDDLRDGYDPEAPVLKLYRRHLDAVRGAAPPPSKLLEVGCARGVFLDLASKAGYAAAGIDRNPHGADYARKHFGVDAMAGEFERSAIAAGSFGVVASYDTIEHVADPRAFMSAVSAALAPGGVAAIGTPDAGSPLLRAAEAAAEATGGAWRYPLWRVYGNGIEHLHLFTRSSMARLARECGLEPFSSYGYSIPVRNMRDLSPLYGAALRLASAVPYEFVMMARKPPHS